MATPPYQRSGTPRGRLADAGVPKRRPSNSAGSSSGLASKRERVARRARLAVLSARPLGYRAALMKAFEITALCAALLAAEGALGSGPATTPPPGAAEPPPGAGEIGVEDIERHVAELAAPELEGRDTPSAGLARAADYIGEAFASAGLEPWGELAGQPAAEPGASAFAWHWQQPCEVPDPQSALELTAEGQRASFELGRDFVPLLEFGGAAEGELVFLGYGIAAKEERFDELRGVELEGRIGLVLAGEPPHAKRFEGPEISAKASLWDKTEAWREAGLAGVVLVRPPPPRAEDGAEPAPEAIGYRYGFALWVGDDNDEIPAQGERLPVVEVTLAAANRLAGLDLAALQADIDDDLRPESAVLAGRRVRLASRTTWRDIEVANVVGFVRGRDPELAAEFVVLGAHYDHVGVDSRGRVGFGADDNASGTAALLELAQAFAAGPARRSVLVCAFAGEEDGLIGSRSFCERLPVPIESIVAMVNLDMVGRGRADEVAVLGVEHTPAFEELLGDARKLSATGVRKIDIARNDRDGLFKRSDHFSFHALGIPTLFFFEGLPISENPDYHTWRDSVDQVDCDKIARTARLVLNTSWLLGESDSRAERAERRKR